MAPIPSPLYVQPSHRLVTARDWWVGFSQHAGGNVGGRIGVCGGVYSFRTVSEWSGIVEIGRCLLGSPQCGTASKGGTSWVVKRGLSLETERGRDTELSTTPRPRKHGGASQMGQREEEEKRREGREVGMGRGVVQRSGGWREEGGERRGGRVDSVTSNTSLPGPDFMVSLSFRSCSACQHAPPPPSHPQCNLWYRYNLACHSTHQRACPTLKRHTPWSVSSHPGT